MLWLPVERGRWQQYQLFDGTYTIDDLFACIENMSICDFNQEQYALARETMQKMERRR